MAVARMRTIGGLYKEIHKMDPSSEVTQHFIRQAVRTGKVKFVRAGKKYLIDLDNFISFLSNTSNEEVDKVPEYGKLRKIT